MIASMEHVKCLIERYGGNGGTEGGCFRAECGPFGTRPRA